MPTKSWGELLAEAGEGGNYDPIPEGDYDLTIKEAKAQQAGTGSMMYVATFQVEGGPHNGRLVWNNFVVPKQDSPNYAAALGFFFRHMNILGLGREYFAQNPSDHQVAEALKGRRVRAHVGIRKWQGQDKNDIKTLYPAGGVSAPPPNGAAPQTAYAAPPPPVASAPPPPPPAAPAAPPPTQVAAPPPPVDSQPAAAPAAPVATPPPAPAVQAPAPAPAPAPIAEVAPPPPPAPVAPPPPPAPAAPAAPAAPEAAAPPPPPAPAAPAAAPAPAPEGAPAPPPPPPF